MDVGGFVGGCACKYPWPYIYIYIYADFRRACSYPDPYPVFQARACSYPYSYPVFQTCLLGGEEEAAAIHICAYTHAHMYTHTYYMLGGEEEAAAVLI